jgi:hypothetical protein
MATAADAVTAMGAITAAVADGVLTIAEARGLADVIDAFRKTLELADIERRLATLEREIALGAVRAG